jgi:hypothetical protein
LAGSPPEVHLEFRADICVRAIGQIERLSAVKLLARVGLRFRFRLRASFRDFGERQLDAGAAGFDAAGVDDVLLLELSDDAGALAVDESLFEASLPELPESDAPSLFVSAFAPSSFFAAAGAPLLPPRKSVTYQPEPFS